MAEIEIGPLTDRLEDDEIKDLVGALKKVGVPEPPAGEDDAGGTLASGLDDDVLAEFLDRLEAYDMACDIYLPHEFDGRVEVADLRVGSAPALLEVLMELKDEIGLDADEDDEEDEDEEDEDEEEDEDDDDDDYGKEIDLIDEQIRRLWKVFHTAAEAAVARTLPLYVTMS